MAADRAAQTVEEQPALREGHIPVTNARLYYREVGQGHPIVILHGGPDFSCAYLLPDMDRLSDSFRLIYYDQRGRGKSAEGVRPEDVTIQAEIEDLESLRKYFGLDSVAVLGHSWGGLLAMEYAIRHEDRVSAMVLMNPAPASRDDYILFREERSRNAPADMEKLAELAAGIAYQEGDPDAVADYYRVHYRAALKRPEDVGRVIESLTSSFTREGILRSWQIEDRLMNQTWRVSGYDLLPALKQLNIPALVIHGESDFVPAICAEHIARAIPGARFTLLRDCGHFSYLERPEEVHREMVAFLYGT